jgi:hypothetical protein
MNIFEFERAEPSEVSRLAVIILKIARSSRLEMTDSADCIFFMLEQQMKTFNRRGC